MSGVLTDTGEFEIIFFLKLGTAHSLMLLLMCFFSHKSKQVRKLVVIRLCPDAETCETYFVDKLAHFAVFSEQK